MYPGCGVDFIHRVVGRRGFGLSVISIRCRRRFRFAFSVEGKPPELAPTVWENLQPARIPSGHEHTAI